MRYAVVALVSLTVLTSCEKAPLSVLEQAEVDFRARKWNEVLTACNQHLAGDPENDQAISLRGRSYLALKRYDEAIDDFTQLIERNPEDCEPLYRRSMAYEALGNDELAQDDKLQARRLDPLRNSAYAYETSNFIDKPSLGGGVVMLDEEGEDGLEADSSESTTDEDEALLAENAESELDRELDQDYFDRETHAEQEAAIKGGDAELTDAFPSSARRKLRYGELDQDFVRGAVTSYRDMLEDERTSSSAPRFTVPFPPATAATSTSRATSSITLDDLLSPAPSDDDKEDEEGDELTPLKPPVSTSLPPGYVGPRPASGMRSTTDFGGMRTPRANSPYASSPMQAPGGLQLNTGLPGAPATTSNNPYALHSNPIPVPGTKPTLSTSLPGTPAAPGTTALPQSVGPPNAPRRFPSMLPPRKTPPRPNNP